MNNDTTQQTARLAAIRHEIDAVDATLLTILNRRAQLSLEVGHIKAAGDDMILNPHREYEVLETLCAINSGPLPNEHLRAIWQAIFASSRALQRL